MHAVILLVNVAVTMAAFDGIASDMAGLQEGWL